MVYESWEKGTPTKWNYLTWSAISLAGDSRKADFPAMYRLSAKFTLTPVGSESDEELLSLPGPDNALIDTLYFFKPAALRSHSLRFVRSALDSIANGCYNHNQYMINNNSSSRTSLMFSLINCIRFFSFLNKSFMWHISFNILKLGFTYHACTDQSTVIVLKYWIFSFYLWLTR